MTAIPAVALRRLPSICGDFRAASARSGKIEITQWALNGLAAMQHVVFAQNVLPLARAITPDDCSQPEAVIEFAQSGSMTPAGVARRRPSLHSQSKMGNLKKADIWGCDAFSRCAKPLAVYSEFFRE